MRLRSFLAILPCPKLQKRQSFLVVTITRDAQNPANNRPSTIQPEHIATTNAIVIGKDKLNISHLQYTNNTISLGLASSNNAWAMQCILKNFELLSVLK
ncbi:hypothetical protein ACS0TY_018204 [Phlomoides rotata]